MATRPRIVLTRERERNRPWAARLAAAGLSVRELPLVGFTALEIPEDFDATRFDWILFTSPQGVRAFHDAGLNPGAARLAGLSEGTAAALAAVGWQDALSLKTRDGVEFAQAFLAVIPSPAACCCPARSGG